VNPPVASRTGAEDCAAFGLLWQNVAKAVSAISAPLQAPSSINLTAALSASDAVQFNARPAVGDTLLEGGSA
jgi:hypothetical protein